MHSQPVAEVINEIVKSTCTDFNIRYQEFPTMLTAIKSHFNYLKYIGQLNDLSKTDIESRVKKWSQVLKIDFALERKLRFYSNFLLFSQ